MIYSTSKKNPHNLSEKSIKALKLNSECPCRNYKKRHLKELSIEEEQSIREIYLDEKVAGTDVAKHFRVSP